MPCPYAFSVMPLTALQLYKNANLQPADFGLLVDPDVSEEEQIAQAIACLDADSGDGESSILKSSFSEVSLPVREAMGNYTSPLTNIGLAELFGELSGEVISLWDLAQTSYGRSELNKRVASNAASYDKDSDQDRIQGNQRLQKLLAFLTAWRLNQSGDVDTASNTIPHSCSVPIISVW